MNKEKAKATKEAVAKTVSTTSAKAHEQVKKIKDSKIGKYLPVEYEKITLNNVAFVSIAFMCFIQIMIYAFCIALDGTYKETLEYIFVKTPTGIAMCVVFLISTLHDMYAYYSKNHHLLLSFLLFRMLSTIVVILALFMLNNEIASTLFKIFLFFVFMLPCILYTYNFSVFISMQKGDGSTANPADHQAV